MKISFIIPLYQAERFIEQCLCSVMNNGLPEKDFEVLVIDDGSKDNGALIVEKFLETHPNVKLFRQVNSGASAARNRGLENANGEWVWFVDADDWIEENVLVKGKPLYCVLQENAIEMVAFNYVRDFVSHTEPVPSILNKEEMNGCDYLLRPKQRLYLWNHLFRRSAIGSKRFIDGTKNIEDFYFDISTIINMNRVLCLPIIGYHYDQRNTESTSRCQSPENLRKLSDDSQTVYLHLLEDIKRLDGRKKDVVEGLLNCSVAGYIYSLFASYDSASLHQGISFLRQHGLYPVPKTNNRKANLFLLMANHEWLIGLMHKVPCLRKING